MTIITRSIKNELSIRRIYEYEEIVEVFITNLKPEKRKELRQRFNSYFVYT
jgi:hypothetical protein